MWPLAFPHGEPMCLGSGMHLDAAARNMQSATLAMLMQPERDAYGEFLLVPTPSPYGPQFDPVLRRFNRFELMGRLGDEFVLDRWLCVLDERLRFLSSRWAQNRIVGRFQDAHPEQEHESADTCMECDTPPEDCVAETDGDISAMERGTYLPPSVVKTD